MPLAVVIDGNMPTAIEPTPDRPSCDDRRTNGDVHATGIEPTAQVSASPSSETIGYVGYNFERERCSEMRYSLYYDQSNCNVVIVSICR